MNLAFTSLHSRNRCEPSDDLTTLDRRLDDRIERSGGEFDLIADEGFRSFLAGLSRDQRAAIVLRYQFDWSIGEVAWQLGRTPDAVSQLLWRALDRLRKDASVESRASRPRDADHVAGAAIAAPPD